jgi:hypothetical protein
MKRSWYGVWAISETALATSNIAHFMHTSLSTMDFLVNREISSVVTQMQPMVNEGKPRTLTMPHHGDELKRGPRSWRTKTAPAS